MRLSFSRSVPYILCCVGAAVSALGIIFPFLWFFTPVGLGFFIYTSWSFTHSYTQAVLLGFLFGASTGGAGIGWFWSALPLTWLTGNAVLPQILAVGIAWLVVSFAFGIGAAMVTPLIWYTRNNIFFPVLVPGIWTITEVSRMWAFSFINYGPESLVGAHFSSAALGYALTEHPFLLPFAQFGGIHALDFLVGSLATLCALLIRFCMQETKRVELFMSGVLCVAIFLPLIFFQTPRRDNGVPIDVYLISTYIPIIAPDTTDMQSVSSLLRSIVSTSTSIIVSPEQSAPDALLPTGQDRQKELQKLFPHGDTLVVTASHVPTDSGNQYSELSYTSTQTGVLATYDKLFLMPIGEYIPSLSSAEFSIIREPRVGHYIDSTRSALKRGTDVTSVRWKGLTVGALVCSDNQSPVLYKTIEKRSHAGVLINVSNTSWFNDSHFLFSKNIQIAKVHAVQNNAYYLSADNMAPAFVVSPSGVVVAQSVWNKASVLTSVIRPE